MSDKIDVLDIQIDKIPVKEVLRQTIDFFDSEPVSIIEVLDSDSVMQLGEAEGDLAAEITGFDLILAGDKEVLEAASVTDRRILDEASRGQYAKTLLRLLHKQKKRVFLLADTEEAGKECFALLNSRYSQIQIVGLAKVASEKRADDMLVNAINGGEIDCIISLLSTPLQEEFIVKNKNLMNARVWLGIGDSFQNLKNKNSRKEKFFQLIKKKMLKKEIKKRQNML